MKKFTHREAITKVLAHIDSHRDTPFDLDTLSTVAGVSKFHFHRVFKEYIGLSLGQYLKLKRGITPKKWTRVIEQLAIPHTGLVSDIQLKNESAVCCTTPQYIRI